MLRALGHARVDRFHLNEGHAALAVLALLEEEIRGAAPADLDARTPPCASAASSPRTRRSPPATIASRTRWSPRCSAPPAQHRLEALGQTRGAEPHRSRAAQRALRERRRDATWRGLDPDVPGVSDPLDHQRHPPRHLGRAGVPGPVRPAPSRVAPRRAFAALRGEDPPRRDLVGARARQAGAARAPRGGRRDRLPRGGLHASASPGAPPPTSARRCSSTISRGCARSRRPMARSSWCSPARRTRTTARARS